MALEATYTEQVVALVSKPQRTWLVEESDRRRCSLAEVVREAIDEKMSRAADIPGRVG